MADVNPSPPADAPPGSSSETDAGPTLRLVRRPAAVATAPTLDASQRAVVEHPRGPLLVLAGPGTGKTTTLVESVVARIDGGVDPERILVLTFSRKAAAELRERITARLARTVREPLARTFHSYAFGVLRREAALHGDPAPRLLSGPEQDLMIRELLRGEVAGDGTSSGWPDDLRPALLTRGFAQELRDLLLRCRERGVDAVALDEIARAQGRADWRAAARFLDQYAAVSALAEPAAYDPSELVRAVVDADLLERERAAYDWVFVDEYQDTDPSQEQLLRALVPRGGNVVAVGDPNQSIYGFRGADVACIRRFPETFPSLDGTPAAQVRLRTNRRSAPVLVEAGKAVADRLRGPVTHRDVEPLPGRAPGRVDVLVAASEAQEASLVAAALRRARVVDGVPWSRMAVIVRSTRGRLPVLRRALVAAGVPVGVAGEEVPLADSSGVRPLLDVLRIAVDPSTLDEALAVELLTGPIGGLDAIALRRLRRELRRVELAGGGRRPSAELLVEALLDPRALTLHRDDVAEPVQGRRRPFVQQVQVRGPATRIALIVRRLRELVEGGATVETLLWEVWQASGLGPRLQAASLAGGARGAAADRDLDAVMALFEAAARFVDRLPKAGPAVFLEHLGGQQIPGDTLAARAPDGEVVRVLTAHAAKGLEWDVVVVAGAQEGVWPDLRVRGSLLGSTVLVDVLAATLHTPGVPPPGLAALLDEERRLFYVAVTRARERLLVTAVSDPEEGHEPSRFLADLPLRDDEGAVVHGYGASGVRDSGADSDLAALRRTVPVPVLAATLRQVVADERQPPGTRIRARDLRSELRLMTRSLDLAALVAELRGCLLDDSASEALRRAAAAQLARLAADGVPGAAPDEWWGGLPLSDDGPLRGPGEPVTVSPSKVEQFTTCELRWLLESVGGATAPGPSQSVGTLVHEVAAALRDTPADEATALAELDRLWADVDLGSAWYTAQMRERAAGMVRRFLEWRAGVDRRLVDVEVSFSVPVQVPDPATGAEREVVLRGQVDRLESDAEGGAFVVDLKTGSSKPREGEVEAHPQLGAYQLAVEAGAFADRGLRAAVGASLVQVGKAAGANVKEQRQAPLRSADDPQWASRLVADVATGMAGSAFAARENDYCQMCPVRASCPLQDEGRQVVGR
jgi:superfamily I DNA/RNA helicase/RecB family exonuclease